MTGWAKVDPDYTPYRGSRRPVIRGSMTPVREDSRSETDESRQPYHSSLVAQISRELARYDLACSDERELFASLETGTPQWYDVEKARSVCRQCSWTEHCRELGDAVEASEGVWGGFTANELRKLRLANARRRPRPTD